MKTAFVTGGTRGIGLAIAGVLLDAGWEVAVTGRSPLARVADTLDALRARGPVSYFPFDAADIDAARSALESAAGRWGRLDMLVNNAGMAPETRADLLETAPGSFDRVMAVNLRGPFFLCQAAARIMLEALPRVSDYHPRIVNIGSVSAYAASVNRGEYCVSKAGLSMVTALFADRLAQANIPVFEIRPGIIRTDMTEAVAERYDRLIAGGLTPIRRWGQPGDVAAAVLCCASGQLDFSTGQVINVDGGFHMRRL